MSLTTEIQQYQDETREGWIPEKGFDPAAKIMSTPRPTPETDAATLCLDCDDSCVEIYTRNQDGSKYEGDVCRSDKMANLERERDEARDRAESKHGLWMAELSRVTELEKQLEAMREAIKDAHYALAYVYNHGAGSCAFPFRTEDDLCSENRFHHVKDALDALKPFIKL